MGFCRGFRVLGYTCYERLRNFGLELEGARWAQYNLIFEDRVDYKRRLSANTFFLFCRSIFKGRFSTLFGRSKKTVCFNLIIGVPQSKKMLGTKFVYQSLLLATH
jgi:hypothetical protein